MAGTIQFSSAKNNYRDMTYNGVVKEIWELDYCAFWIHIFKYDWVESNNKIKVDKLGFTCVNLSKVRHKENPFILGSQENQVFFVNDLMESGWSIALLA